MSPFGSPVRLRSALPVRLPFGLPPAGNSLEHTFLFTDRSDALRSVDRFADRGPVTISKDPQGWWVTIAGAAGDDPEAHARIAAEVAALGGQDRGMGRMTVTTKIHVK